MKIASTAGPQLTVYLGPDDCLLLVRACQLAADNADEGSIGNTPDRVLEGALYRHLTYLFEGYALVAEALGELRPDQRKALDLAHIRRECGVLPGDRGE
jgi:hypothetical protein